MTTRYCFSVWALALLALASAGCRGPLHVITRSDVSLRPAPIKSIEPVAFMQVVPGSCDARIALVDLDGLLVNSNLTGPYSAGENPVSAVREKLDRIARDPSFRAVVLRINSPGGGVTASDIIWHDIEEFKARCGIPVVVCLMDTAAGGAYYVATAGDYIVAHPTTITGGIGVILNLYNLQDTLAQFNILGTPIKAGEHIDIGTPIQRLPEQSEAILQQIADQFHARFRELVQQRRPASIPRPASVFDGRILTAQQAVEIQLVDQIGYVDDAIDIARRMGNAPGAQVVALHRPSDCARTPYDITPNTPIHNEILPTLPGLSRSAMPTFLYMWQPEPTMAR